MNVCPFCGIDRADCVSAGSVFFRCRGCGTVFNTGYTPLEYSDSYFTDDYKTQYGITYADDFPNIYKSARTRISRILSLWKTAHTVTPHSVLDIGCALGFFLKGAADSGFTRIEGIEVSHYAADYCRNRFGYQVTETPFETAAITRSFDVITAWYFLEHCADSKGALDKIYHSLNEGGVFAFSMPSVFGPLYLFSRKRWVESHPVDHRVDVSPRAIRRILRASGFRRITIRPAGIHPERIISRRNPFYILLAPLYRMFSLRFAFSDTIEVYAMK